MNRTILKIYNLFESGELTLLEAMGEVFAKSELDEKEFVNTIRSDKTFIDALRTDCQKNRTLKPSIEINLNNLF